MKRLVMKRAWELYRKGFAETFRQCLKASWELTKKENTYFQIEEMSNEELNALMKNDKNFRHRVNGSNLSQNLNYTGKGIVSYENLKLWIKKGLVRIYADKKIDGVLVGQNYVQTRI